MSTQSTPVTLGEALQRIQKQGLDRLDAQMLLLTAVDRQPNDRAWLLSHDTDPLPSEAADRLTALVTRRLQGEPMAYIQGEKSFFGLNLRVDARVLVPRPDTETLVQWAIDAIESMRDIQGPARVLDLGTGSGAIALAVKAQCPTTDVTASDASDDALAVARANGKRLQLDVCFVAGDWFQAVPGQQFHVITSNPPYIAEGDHHLAALTHEPISALTSGSDGLDDLKTLVCNAPSALKPGGWLLLEHGHDQAAGVCELLHAAGFAQVGNRTDLGGIARCSGGQWPVGR